MAKQCWSQTVLESGSWGHSVLQTPALVDHVSVSLMCKTIDTIRTELCEREEGLILIIYRLSIDS